ncbi:DNA alkylation repair protein [Marinomonas sp. 2405UD68-3]|uniref:DNA alkylation repair protein n=1 Tax=Marinomonas sp. 2405UD68-3 TaxID=3391835 RepID=UPI0039C8C270
MELMKNGLSAPAFSRLACALDSVLVDFDKIAFLNECADGVESLELKERVAYIISILHRHLPSDFPEAAAVLSNIVPIWDFGEEGDALRSFAAWPLIDYIAEHGLSHPDVALPLMKTLTPLFSAEFAIRPFILAYPDVCHGYFLQWCDDTDEHVRRLASEGTRPRLPWGIQLKPFVLDPTPTLVYLNALKADSSLYVRRSVANHLNDIAKDHPDVVIDLCNSWQQEFKGKVPDDVQWVINHATRTLVKQGHPAVFALLGYTDKPMVVSTLVVTEALIKLGESLNFELSLTDSSLLNETLSDLSSASVSTNTQTFVVDYAIHFVKANGASSAKVFKLKNVTLKQGQTLLINKAHGIKPITTRKYYPGEHKVEILINGLSVASQSFHLHIE